MATPYYRGRLSRQFPSDSILFGISHRDTVLQHHGRQLELLGNDTWGLETISTAR